MDSITVQRLISEALKQSPTSGNGFGFGLAVVVVVGGLCIAGVVALWKANRRDARAHWESENEARVEARKQLNDNIDKRFDRLELQTEKAFDGFAAESKEDRVRIEKHGERLARLETKLGMPPMEGG
jgi:hypothetical protein